MDLISRFYPNLQAVKAHNTWGSCFLALVRDLLSMCVFDPICNSSLRNYSHVLLAEANGSPFDIFV